MYLCLPDAPKRKGENCLTDQDDHPVFRKYQAKGTTPDPKRKSTATSQSCTRGCNATPPARGRGRAPAASCTTSLCLCKLFKELFPSASQATCLFSGCKGTNFLPITKIFPGLFSLKQERKKTLLMRINLRNRLSLLFIRTR